jgi:hypothetical protein
MVFNPDTKQYHGLKMTINKNNVITYGYLSGDSTVFGPAIAKFTSLKLIHTTPDTLGIHIAFRGRYLSPDSGIFSSTLYILSIDNQASGTLTFQNFPPIKNPIKVTGKAVMDIGNSGYMDLTTTTTPFYRLSVKIHSGMYDAIIYDERGYVIADMKNYGSY